VKHNSEVVEATAFRKKAYSAKSCWMAEAARRVHRTVTTDRALWKGWAMLTKRSFTIAGHRTSIALEAEFWVVLDRIAKREGTGLAAVIAAVDAGRSPPQPLASALRLHALAEAQAGVH
jgi:predicted DNA-binding ribbon-helix-helix protein